MAIEFVVEDGTGLVNSTSYISIANFKQYWENRGITFIEPDDTIKAWLNRGTQYIDSKYQILFDGVPTNETQSLQFPRSISPSSWSNDTYNYSQLCDRRTNRWIADNEIPDSLVFALAEIGYIAKDTTNLFGTNIGIKSKSLDVGSVEYTSLKANGNVEYSTVDYYVSGLLKGGGIVRQ